MFGGNKEEVDRLFGNAVKHLIFAEFRYVFGGLCICSRPILKLQLVKGFEFIEMVFRFPLLHNTNRFQLSLVLLRLNCLHHNPLIS